MRELVIVVLAIALTWGYVQQSSPAFANPVPPVEDGPGGRTSGGAR